MTAPTDEREELAYILWCGKHRPPDGVIVAEHFVMWRMAVRNAANAPFFEMADHLLAAGYRRPTPPGQDLVTRAQDWLLNAASKQWAWDKSVASLAAEFAEVEKAAVERAAEMAGRYDEDIAKAIRSAGK